MATDTPPTGELLTARAAHLNMIQGIVARLATFSANAKNFCVTVFAAILGIAFQQNLPLLLIVGTLVLVAFAALDVYYLAQERRFRGLYREVENRPLSDAVRMDLSPSKLTLGDYVAAVRSFSTGGFYTVLLIVEVALLFTFDGRTEEAGVGLMGGAASAAEAQRVGGSVIVAPRAGPNGRETVAADSEPLRSELAEPAANLGAERPIRNTAQPATGQRDVR